MSRLIALRDINVIVREILEEAREEAQASYQRCLDRAEEQVRYVELNRQAAALLDGAGIDLDLPSYVRGGRIEVNLGFFPHTKAGNALLAEKMRNIRLALGCRLTQTGKDVQAGKTRHITFIYRPVDWPGVCIEFQRKLPRQVKCKIVTHRSTYRTLVCEV